MAEGTRPDVVIVGGGIFGATAALELRTRGATVTLLDQGPLPHAGASSTDLSKLVRADYGNDELYASLMFEALRGWRHLNAWAGAELFHETGVLILSTTAMEEGTFERASFDLLTKRGRTLERLEQGAIREAFPAWGEGAYRDGYVSVEGGWAESGRVVRAYLDRAISMGVVVRETGGVLPIPADQSAPFVVTRDGDRIDAGHVVVAAGPFTPVVVPELADRLTPIAQSVLYFVPPDPQRFSPPRFLPWAADIARTGWYGFPLADGLVKIANHGPGRIVDPAAPRAVRPDAEPKFRAFLSRALPELADCKLGRTHVCLYCDSTDGDFFIDRHPARRWLSVAAGGSGHAFKFAPLLGRWIADVAQGLGPAVPRFGWREPTETRYEDARCVEPA